MYFEFIKRKYIFSLNYKFNKIKKRFNKYLNNYLEKIYGKVTFEHLILDNFKFNSELIEQNSKNRGFKKIIKFYGFKNLKISFLNSKASVLYNKYIGTKKLNPYNKKNILKEKKIIYKIKILKLKKECFSRDITNTFFYQNVAFKIRNNKFNLNCMAYKKI